MLDDRVLEVLARLEGRRGRRARGRAFGGTAVCARSSRRRGASCSHSLRRRQGIEILEIGGSRGYSSIWLAAGARVLGGRLTAGERPWKCTAWRTNVADAGLDEWAELVDRDAFETLQGAEDTFDLVFLDAEKDDYEALFALARLLLEPGGADYVVADNVLSHVEPLGAYSAARQADATLSSVTVPLDRGLELSVALA